MRTVKVDGAIAGQRFDKFLARYMNEAPKSFIHKMLRKKNITVNGKKSTGAEILKEGDVVKLFLAEETIRGFTKEKRINRNLVDMPEIIFEDKNILIVNKPKGMLSHPDTKTKESLIDRVLLYLHNKGEYELDAPFTPALANRLDKNTSGLVVCGKNLKSLQALNEMIKQKQMSKFYQTIVIGEVDNADTLVGFHTKDGDENKVSIGENGEKEVITKYKPLEKFEGYTLLEIELITGKSHQIRAHLQSVDYPILGDPKYGESEKNSWLRSEFGIRNQLLHSYKIIFGAQAGPLSYLKDETFSVESNEIQQVIGKLKKRG